jgi:hypothetical protein
MFGDAVTAGLQGLGWSGASSFLLDFKDISDVKICERSEPKNFVHSFFKL